MISLNNIWIYIRHVLIWPDFKEVIICYLLLSRGSRVMIVNLSVAHLLLLIVNHLRVHIKYVLQLIWILNGLRSLLIATPSLCLFYLLCASSYRWLPLLWLLMLWILLLVNYRHFRMCRPLQDTAPMAILLWYTRIIILSIILELWTE